MSEQLDQLRQHAAEFEGVVLLGCDAACETVHEATRHSDCRVIQGMEVEGIMNVVPTVSFPFNISLVVQSMTSVNLKSQKKSRKE